MLVVLRSDDIIVCYVSIIILCKTKMSTCSSEFAFALSHALFMLGTPDMSLKKEQEQAILAVYGGKDVFVWLPTGFGKSVCFQTLPFVFDYKLGLLSAEKKSIVFVVAPLVALMVDQVQSLRSKNVRAVIISSGGREGKVAKDLLATEDTLDSASLVFCSPESLLEDKWRDTLEKPGISGRVCAVVVDEAHCVSKWYVRSCTG